MKQDPSPKTDRRILAIFLIVLIDVLGLTIIIPLLPFYSEHFGASALMVGALISTYALCQLVSGPVLGHWSDQIGRKPVLIVSQIGTCIGFIILVFARSISWIFVSRIIDGLTAGNISTAQAYITDVASPEERAKQLSKVNIAFSIGFFVGPALTAGLYHFGFQAPIIAAAGLSATSILASSLLLPKVKRIVAEAGTSRKFSIKRVFEYVRRPGLNRLFFQIFLFYFSFGAYVAGFALFAERRFTYNGHPLDPRQIGYAFAYFGFLGIIIRTLLIGPLLKKFGETRTILIGFVSCFFGYCLLAFIDGPFWIAATGLGISLGSSLLRPVLISSIAGSVGPRERGSVIGVTQSIESIAQISAPLIGTSLIGRGWLVSWTFISSVPCLLGVAIVYLGIKNMSRNTTPAEVNA